MIYIDLPIKDGGFHWFPRATFNNQSALKCVFPGNPGVKNCCFLDHGDSRPKMLIYVTWTIPEKKCEFVNNDELLHGI